jgi:hypothetical protein
MKSSVFCDKKSCSPAKFNLRFRGTYLFFLEVEEQTKQVTRQNALLSLFLNSEDESDFLDSPYSVEGKLLSACEHCKEPPASMK